MNAWGPGPFDNDLAMEFCELLSDHPDPLWVLREALIMGARGPVTVKDGLRTVAAAHLLALELGFGEETPLRDCKPPLWAIPQKDAAALRPLAAQALARVLAPSSPLRQRREERDAEGQAWVAAVERIYLHLEAPADTPPPPRPFWE